MPNENQPASTGVQQIKIADNIKKYEDQFGEIKIADAPQTNAGLGFEDRK